MNTLRRISCIILTALLVLSAVPLSTTHAVSEETANCSDIDACFYSEVSSQCVDGASVAAAVPGNETLPASVPAPYHDIFVNAANKQGTPAALVAAIFFAGEHGSSWPDPPPPYGGGRPWASSNKGANGPFQFLNSTWAGYKIDGDGDGDADIQDLVDGAYGAANYLGASGGKIGAPEADLRKAIFAYNHANWYVDNVMEAYHSFITGGTGAAPAGAPQGSSDSCGGNIGVSADGFVFPQKTTKAQLKRNGWSATCTNKISQMTGSKGNPVRSDGSVCHHDYLAADVLNDTGVTVVSPRPGRVIKTKDNNVVKGSSSGASVRIYSDPALGGDGLYYYLTHMLPASKDPGAGIQVTDGQVITAGQILGVVGTAADAQGTIPHTHIDISPVENGFSRSSSGTEGPLLDPMPALKGSYDKLPDN